MYIYVIYIYIFIHIYNGNKSKYTRSNAGALTRWRHLVSKGLHNPITDAFRHIRTVSMRKPQAPQG